MTTTTTTTKTKTKALTQKLIQSKQWLDGDKEEDSTITRVNNAEDHTRRALTPDSKPYNLTLSLGYFAFTLVVDDSIRL
jgi:hypothetical protein